MPKPQTSVNLPSLAFKIMQDRGFNVEPPAAAIAEAKAAELNSKPTLSDGAKDQRALLWSSIDNQESRDLDQIEYVEKLGNGDIRLMVGIADVDVLAPKGSAIDQAAFQNGTSVYTGVRVFPMLPEQLSTDKTSLVENEDRSCVVVDMVINANGDTKSADVYMAVVRNKAKLAYDSVSDWFDNGGKLEKLSTVNGLEEQLRLQEELHQRLRRLQTQNGALGVQTLEAQPVAVDGVVIDLQLTEENRARDIIQTFMITANSALSSFMQRSHSPLIQRVVRKPDRWNRLVDLAKTFDYTLPEEADAPALAKFVADRRSKDPEHFPDLSLAVVKLLGPGEYIVQIPGQPSTGHFGLAMHDYTHATAPNRRYCDLATQRIVKALVQGKPCPYSVEELQAVAKQCMDREEQARKVERYMRKAAAAVLLSSHIGQTYKAIVTGASSKGTYVRLLSPPAEGRVTVNERGLDVGDKVTVKLINTNAQQGFIDFQFMS